MKLLHRTRRSFWIYAAVVMLLSVPVYYLVLQHQWSADIDEDLVVQKRKLEQGLSEQRLNDAQLDSAIADINALGIGFRIERMERSMPEHHSTIERYDAFHGHAEPFRTYTGTMQVNGRPYSVTVSRVIEETEELVAAIATIACITLLLLFGGVLLLDRLSAKRIWAPFHAILARLKRFQVDDAEPFRARSTGVVEFDELQYALEQLTTRNMAIYTEQRRFTENAAHELRTPIALLQGKLERLYQSRDLTQEQATLLEEAGTVLARMRRSHEGLLLLARLDNIGTIPDTSCDPHIIVRQLLAHSHERVQELDLHITVNAEVNSIWRMEPSMAETLLGNLVSNSIRHNVPGGRVVIEVYSTAFSIGNTAEGPALDP